MRYQNAHATKSANAHAGNTHPRNAHAANAHAANAHAANAHATNAHAVRSFIRFVCVSNVKLNLTRVRAVERMCPSDTDSVLSAGGLRSAATSKTHLKLKNANETIGI